MDFIATFLDESIDIFEQWMAILESKDAPDVKYLFRVAHNLKGSSKSVGLEEFSKVVHEIEDLLQEYRDGQKKVNQNFTNVMILCHDYLKKWIFSIREKLPFHHDHSYIRKILDLIDLDISEKEFFEKISSSELKNLTLKGQKDETIRVSVKKMENMIGLLGEMNIHIGIIKHNLTKDIKKSLEFAQLSENMILQMQKEILGMRTHTIETLFHRLEKTVLDISKKLNKKVIVECSGFDTELDRSILEKIKDPMVHLVRNSIDHGIEDFETREKNKKSKEGHIWIDAQQLSRSVEIKITDDGKGLSFEKIRKKAIENHLIQESDDLSEDQILSLIFLPGFSTAKEITDVSGRGVGLDVVKSTVESLKGNLKVESKEGMGCIFTISIPTDIAIIEAMIVESCEQLYAVPLTDIEEILIYEETPIETSSFGDKMIKYNDHSISLKTLDHHLGLNNNESKNNFEKHSILVASTINRKKRAFSVEAIHGLKKIVFRNLHSSMEEIEKISGVTILGTGLPCMIINLKK